MIMLLSKTEIIDIVEKIRNTNNLAKESDNLMKRLEKEVIDPEISNDIYYTEMTAEEIAEKALSYKLIYL